MFKNKALALVVCLIYLCTCIPAFAEDIVGTPYDGTAVVIASSGTTTIYAAKKNKDASDTGAKVYDTYNSGYTIDTNLEAMAVKAAEDGVSWYYTVNVAEAGLYKIDILGWSGWVDSLEKTDGGGRFSFEIGGTKLVDGTADSPVILPPWGDGTASNSHKAEWEFTDEDKTALGIASLDVGEQVIKITADNNAGYSRMGISRIYFTASDSFAPEGESWSGEPVKVSSEGTTQIYAARKNKCALDSDAVVYDIYQWENTVVDNPEKMAVTTEVSGTSWYYAVDIEKAGLYRIDALGWSGYASSAETTDGGGRFSFEIGGTKLVDGKGDSPVILPPWGDGTASGGHKGEYQFTDEDKTSLGAVYLTKGIKIIKVTADTLGVARMGFNKFYFTQIDCGIGNPQMMISVGQPNFSCGSVSLQLTSYENKVGSAIMLAALKKSGMLVDINISEPVNLQPGTSVALNLSDLRTDLSNGEHYVFYVWKGLDNIIPITASFYATAPFYGDAAFSAPPPETRLSDDELNEAYNFITASDGGFKGMYASEDNLNDTALIQNIKASGVNAFLVHIFRPESMTETEYKSLVNKWQTAIGDTKLYVVIGYGSDSIYTNTQFGAYINETGLGINAPCPQSEEYWNKVYAERAKWAYEAGADGCIIDMEMYAADVSAYSSCCYCDNCWNDFCKAILSDGCQTITSVPDRVTYLTDNNMSDAYKNFQTNKRIQILSVIRDDIPETFMLGYMYYFETLDGITQGLGTPTAPALIFDEYTYYADGSGGYKYDEMTWFQLRDIHRNDAEYNYGKPGILLPGFYPECYTADKQKEVIDTITSITYGTEKYSVDGFWIYAMYIEEIAGDKQNPTDYVTSLAEIKPKNNY